MLTKRHDKIGHQGGRGLRPRITLSIVRRHLRGQSAAPLPVAQSRLGTSLFKSSRSRRRRQARVTLIPIDVSSAAAIIPGISHLLYCTSVDRSSVHAASTARFISAGKSIQNSVFAITSSDGYAIGLLRTSSGSSASDASFGELYPIYSALAAPTSASNRKLINISAHSFSFEPLGITIASTKRLVPSSGTK